LHGRIRALATEVRVDSQRFDHLVRMLSAGSDRRRLVWRGIGALVASAGGIFVSGAVDPVEARKSGNHHHHRKERKKEDRAWVTICYQGGTRDVRKNGFRKRYKGATRGACTCSADFPIACGTGCCATNFPRCCPGNSFLQPPGKTPTGFCAPATTSCCPVDAGGGMCDTPNPQCCPPTYTNPRGYCAPVDATCCPGANVYRGTAPPGLVARSSFQGVCPAPFTKCCAASATNPNPGCCRPSQLCCGSDADCLAGQVCNINGCCSTEFFVESEGDVGSGAIGDERIGVPAR
jgi:hypothetical protein